MAVTIAAALFAVVAVPALPQNSDSAAAAPMKPKPKTSSGGTITVKVTNWREADLVELQATEGGSANWKKVLGTLKAGQWTWAKVPQGNALPQLLFSKRRDAALGRQRQDAVRQRQPQLSRPFDHPMRAGRQYMDIAGLRHAGCALSHSQHVRRRQSDCVRAGHEVEAVGRQTADRPPMARLIGAKLS